MPTLCVMFAEMVANLLRKIKVSSCLSYQKIKLAMPFCGYVCGIFHFSLRFRKLSRKKLTLAQVGQLIQQRLQNNSCQVVHKGRPTCWRGELGFITQESIEVTDCFPVIS